MSDPTTNDVLLGALRRQTVALQMTATALLEVLALIDSPAPERWVAPTDRRRTHRARPTRCCTASPAASERGDSVAEGEVDAVGFKPFHLGSAMIG